MKRLLPLAALLLAGCGGTSGSSTASAPQPSSTPEIYAYSPQSATTPQEVSGFTGPSGSPVYVTGGLQTTAAVVTNGEIGAQLMPYFTPAGIFSNGQLGVNAAPGAQVVFVADVAAGDNDSGAAVPITPSSVAISSPEPGQSGFHVALAPTSSVDAAGSGIYESAPFTLPYTTTGVHTTVASVTDAAGRTVTTSFGTLVVAPGASAVMVQVLNGEATPPSPLPGAGVTISGVLSSVNAYNPPSFSTLESVTDADGIGIVFATPGAQTLTVSYTPPGASSAISTTVPLTLTSGQVYDAVNGKPFTVTLTGAIPAGKKR